MKRLAVIVLLGVMMTQASADDRGLKLKLKQMQSEQRVALVVGNADYETFGDLRNPVNDARAMRDALEARKFEVLYLENAEMREMTRAFRKFEHKLTQGGVGLFYYAGHGVSVEGKNYLIPVDGDIKEHNEVRFESIEVDRVLAKMKSAGNRLNLVILDACRNDPTQRDGGGGLAPLDAAKGMYIAFATAPGKTAADGSGDNGIFTGALLRRMKEPQKVEEVFKSVRADVMSATQNVQVPWTSSSITGDFFFTLPVERYALTVLADPSDARVRIMNIPQRYRPGIKLAPDRYEILVEREGYRPIRQTYMLDGDLKIPVVLPRIESPEVAMKTQPHPQPLPSKPAPLPQEAEEERDYTWWYVGGGVALLAAGGAAAAAGGGGGGDDGGAPQQTVTTSDTIVTLTWDGENNLDLVVEDPCGNHITAANPTATCESNQGTLTQESNADTVAASPKETIRFAGGGKKGEYFVYVNDTFNRNGSSTAFTIETRNNDTTNTASGTVDPNALLPVVYFTH